MSRRHGASLRLAVWVLLAALGGCAQDSAGPAPDRRTPGRVPQQVLSGVKLQQTSVRGLLWILEADEGLSYGPDEPTELSGMRVRFYDGQQQVRSVLTSRRGYVDDKTQSLVAQDSVVVVTPQGERLETHSLRWDPKRERISTEDPFRFLRGMDVLTGIGFEADPDLTHYTVRRQVRAELRSQRDETILEELDGDSTGGGPDSGR